MVLRVAIRGDEIFQRKSAERVEHFCRESPTIVFVSNDLPQFEQLCETVAEFGQRWGSGEIVISDVRLLDDEGESVITPTTMDPMTIVIDLDAHMRIQDAVVTLGIDTLAGHPVWSSSTRRNQLLLGPIDPGAQVEIAIVQLPLLERMYGRTVAVTDTKEMRPYDHWDKRIRFEMKQFTVYDEGVVHIAATWQATGTRGALEGQG